MQQPDIKTYVSSVSDIQGKLNKLAEKMKQVDNEFNPGLSREEITEKTKNLPFLIPEELYQLYMWRNGTRIDSDLFIFRDHNFIPLEQAIEEYKVIEEYYEITNVFPFASFQASFLTLPIESYSDDIELWPLPPNNVRLERPVIEIFQGVSVFAYSFSIMLDMVIEWFEHGLCGDDELFNSEHAYKEDLELRIWEKHNPGLNEIPEFVYVPADNFQQTLTIQASKYTIIVDEPVILNAVRQTGPFVKQKFDSVPIGTCWWRFLPPEHEEEVASNINWEIQPDGIARFNTVYRADGAREATFSKPGKYQVKGYSVVWCSPGIWSNSIEILVL